MERLPTASGVLFVAVWPISIIAENKPRNFNRKFYELRRKAGLGTDINLHALRHSFATRLLEKSVHPKIVQELLGHSRISMTLDTYSHVMPELKHDALALLNGTLTPTKKKPSVAPED